MAAKRIEVKCSVEEVRPGESEKSTKISSDIQIVPVVVWQD